MDLGENQFATRRRLSLRSKDSIFKKLISTILIPSLLVSSSNVVFHQRAQANAQLAAMAAASGVSLAGLLGSLLPALASLASGATALSEGAQEKACCAQGCYTGAGQNAAGRGAGISNAAQGAARGIAPVRRIPQFKELERIHILDNNCLKLRPGLSLYLFPANAQAAGGCADASMAMAQGAMQMLAGLLGMLAALANQGNKDKNDGNANNLSNVSRSPSAASPSGTQVPGSGKSEPINIASALLRDGKADAIFSKFEDRFGIPRDKFAAAVANGADIRDLLANAPKNAMSRADLDQALAEAKGASAAQLNAATELGLLGEYKKELASKLDEDFNLARSGSKIPTRPSSSEQPTDLSLEEPEKTGLITGGVALSPEVQSALDNERYRRRLAGDTGGLSIFQVVHMKYQEKMKQVFGHGIGGVPNADGT